MNDNLMAVGGGGGQRNDGSTATSPMNPGENIQHSTRNLKGPEPPRELKQGS